MKGFVSVLVGLVLAIAIIAIGNFGFHIPEGGGRGWLVAGAALVFFVFAFGPGRLWGRGGNLNSFALLAVMVFVVPEWLQMIFGFVLLALFVIGRTISTAPHISRPAKQQEPQAEVKKWFLKRSN
jgi:hypothetical protein